MSARIMDDRAPPSNPLLQNLAIVDYDCEKYDFRAVLSDYLGLDGPPETLHIWNGNGTSSLAKEADTSADCEVGGLATAISLPTLQPTGNIKVDEHAKKHVRNMNRAMGRAEGQNQARQKNPRGGRGAGRKFQTDMTLQTGLVALLAVTG